MPRGDPHGGGRDRMGQAPHRPAAGSGFPWLCCPSGSFLPGFRILAVRFVTPPPPPRASLYRHADIPLGASLHLRFCSRSCFCPSEQKCCKFQKFSLMVIPFSPIRLMQPNNFKLPPIPEVHDAQFFCSNLLFFRLS